MFPAIIFNCFSFVCYHYSNNFLAYHYAPETRYTVEVYPAMIAACGVSIAAVWLGNFTAIQENRRKWTNGCINNRRRILLENC